MDNRGTLAKGNALVQNLYVGGIKLRVEGYWAEFCGGKLNYVRKVEQIELGRGTVRLVARK